MLRWKGELTVLDKYIAHVPEYKWHWSSWLGLCFFGVVPSISIPVNPTCAVAVNVNTLTRDDEPSSVILERNWIRVISPIVEVVGHLMPIS